MTYNFSATQNNGRIVSSADGVTGENVSYTYDSLNRLIAAATTNPTGPIWGNSYSYDGFGNLTGKTVTQGTAPSALPQVNSATNQARMIGDYGFDANGNWLGMGSQSNAWNVENQLISNGMVDYGGNPLTYTYDPWGKRVLQYSVGGIYGPTGTIYFYSITGQRLAIYTGQYPNELTQTSVNMYFGSRLLAPVDRLGSVRQNGNGPIAYYPWGEERTSTPDGTDKFGTYFRDATNNGIGEDYASARYYNNNFGRFWSADPAGIKATNPKNPMSWNRYAYANDDPVNRFDPSGRGSGFVGSDPNDPTSGGSGQTTGCTTFADEGGWSTGGWTLSDCWYTGIGDPTDPNPTGSDDCNTPSNSLMASGGGGSCGGDDEAPQGAIDCEEMLVDEITALLMNSNPSLASYASTMEAVGASDNIDPRLFAAIAVGENGQYKNNPFGLGRNGSGTYASLDGAIAALGVTLEKYIFTWHETTVSQLWSGNTWQTNPRKPWQTTQPPGYCVGTNAAAKAACQNTGATIAGALTSEGGNPNSLTFPCDADGNWI
jgi:RHS repeat-associated protein